MAHDKGSDFVFTHYLNLTAQRGTKLETSQTGSAPAQNFKLDQVPFVMGAKGSAPALRRYLEAILAIQWTVTDVSSTSYNVTKNDVVLLVDTGAARTINLPAVSERRGRVLLIKDEVGTASSNNITVSRAGSDTIDGNNTSVVMSANFGSILLIAGNGTEWHVLAIS
jgi:hypothetical protein